MTANNKRIGVNPSSSNSVSANARWQRLPAPPEPQARTFAAGSLKASKIADANELAADDSSEVQYPGTVLTVADAARRLRISRWSLYSLIHSRKLKTFKIGKRRLIAASAVDDLIEQLQGEAE